MLNLQLKRGYSRLWIPGTCVPHTQDVTVVGLSNETLTHPHGTVFKDSTFTVVELTRHATTINLLSLKTVLLVTLGPRLLYTK